MTVPPADVMENMLDGQIRLEDIPTETGVAVRIQAVFFSASDEVWRHLEDCQDNFRFVPGLRECEILEASERSALTRQVVKPYWYAPRQEFTFTTTREPYDWIAINLEHGDFRALSGSWRFDPVAGQSEAILVTHQISLEPVTPAPRWMVRRTLNTDLPEMFACLRFLSGGSHNEQQASSDEAQCLDEAPSGR